MRTNRARRAAWHKAVNAFILLTMIVVLSAAILVWL